MNIKKAKLYVANLILKQTNKYTLDELLKKSLNDLEEISFKLHREGKVIWILQLNGNHYVKQIIVPLQSQRIP